MIDANTQDERKTVNPKAENQRCPLQRNADGSVAIHSYALASQILRSGATRQAGFNAALVEMLPQKNKSVLFKEGEAHRRQRVAVARFFAPKAVNQRYRVIMNSLSLRLVDQLKTQRTLALDDLSLTLSVAVAAEIVGLTESLWPGMGKRLNRFFDLDVPPNGGWWSKVNYLVRSQASLLLVYLLDVAPAIRDRRRTRREDLISHLLEQKSSAFDILTECVTYSTAGMSTTREFIVVAAWHLLEREELRQRFLAAPESARLALIEEILRLEPPVGTLMRRTNVALTLEHSEGREEIAADTLLAIDVRAANADQAAVGPCPHRLDPDRHAPHMSFGDGHHKCPGAPVALQETCIFLDHLLRLPGLRLLKPPAMAWNSTTTGYVLRGAILTLD